MLEVLPLEAGGARLVRVYGQDPCVVLPGSVPAPAGGSWPITELGDYCFSEKPRSLPASDAVCRYQVDDTGAVRLTRAFGQAVGGSARRYDFDFDAPAADPDDLHPVCGSFVEEVTLPDRLQVIGSCAFYNCRKLRLLTVGAEGLTLGSDVFLNCFALETIRVQAEADAAQFTNVYNKFGYYMLFNKGRMIVMLNQNDMPEDVKSAVPAYIKSHVDRNICKINF